MNCRSAFSVSGSGKWSTCRRFSSVNEVPMLVIRCPTYSSSLRPSLVFAGFAVTFFSRSLPSTLRVLPRYSLSAVLKSSTSSIYISHICVWHSRQVPCWPYYVEIKGPSLWVPWLLGSIQTVHLWIRMQRCLMIPCSEINNAKDFGFQSPYSIDNLLDVGHPSSPPVAEFNRTKSRLTLRSRLGH